MPRYDPILNPSAPFVDVLVVHPVDTSKSARLRGKLDTGADLSVIPEALAANFQLPGRGIVTGQSYKDDITTHRAYSVSFEIDGFRLNSVKVVATPRRDVLLGRNVLNEFVITLDGKTLTFEMQDP